MMNTWVLAVPFGHGVFLLTRAVPINPLTHSQEAVVLVVVVVVGERVVIPASPGDTKMGRSGSPRSYLVCINI